MRLELLVLEFVSLYKKGKNPSYIHLLLVLLLVQAVGTCPVGHGPWGKRDRDVGAQAQVTAKLTLNPKLLFVVMGQKADLSEHTKTHTHRHTHRHTHTHTHGHTHIPGGPVD